MPRNLPVFPTTELAIASQAEIAATILGAGHLYDLVIEREHLRALFSRDELNPAAGNLYIPSIGTLFGSSKVQNLSDREFVVALMRRYLGKSAAAEITVHIVSPRVQLAKR